MASAEYYYYYYSRSYLNPNAPEFHPIFHTYYFTNNHNFTINYHHNYYHPPPPPPHHHPHHPHATTINYRNYPYDGFFPNVDHHHHVNLIMQPQPQLGHSTAAPLPAHLSPNPSQVRPKIQSSGPEDGGARTRRRLVDCVGSSSSTKYEKKEGYDCIISDKNDLEKGRGRVIRSPFGRERKFEKQIFMNVKPNGTETTAMIRNIPNQYTREMLIKFLDEFCQRENQNMEPNDDHQPFAFDFIYLPMDFKRDANKGYAFVNFTHPIAVWKFHLACSNQRWEHCKSPKICRINYASIQGYEKLVEHFGRSRFVCNHEDYLPLCFNPPRDGSGASVTETTIGKRFSSSSNLARNSSIVVRN